MNAIDTSVLHTLYALRDPALVQVLIYLSELGSTLVIGTTAICVGLLFVVREKISHFLGLSIAIVGTGATVYALKEIVARARPDAFYQAYLETGFAFPSGHASLSLALYGFLAYLAWKYLPQPWAGILVAASLFVVGIIGFSRLYLGLHYTSDVVAGYAIAAAFLALSMYVIKKLSGSLIWS